MDNEHCSKLSSARRKSTTIVQTEDELTVVEDSHNDISVAEQNSNATASITVNKDILTDEGYPAEFAQHSQSSTPHTTRGLMSLKCSFVVIE